MNIAFICNTLHGGGAERFTANISNCFCEEEENRVFVITGAKDVKDYKIDEKIFRLDFLTKNLFKDCRLILKAINEYKIKVLVGIDIYPNLCVSICSLFTKARCVISERNAPKQVNISNKSRVLRWLLYRFADGYVFQTNAAKKFYSKSIQEKSIVIHNPIRPDLPYKSSLDNKEIVAVGRLNIQKNYPMLIKAFSIVHKRHPEYKLRIFGEGEQKKKLVDMVVGLHLQDSVSFEGFTLNVHEAIKDSAIFVMTSNFEGMPNSLMEAMAMGFAVVSTDCPCGGPAELIQDGKNGILIPVGRDDILTLELEKLISDLTLRKQLGFSAKEIRITHSSNCIAKLWNDFLIS